MAEPIRVTKRNSYVPEAFNEGRKDGDKIVVHYRYLTFAEQQELLRHEDIGINFAYEARILSRMIERIDNLQVADDDVVRDITDGDSLVNEPGVDKLAMELWMHFRRTSALTDADKKK